jgi:uncharacterized protein YjbI with pentapeptide repeats
MRWLARSLAFLGAALAVAGAFPAGAGPAPAAPVPVEAAPAEPAAQEAVTVEDPQRLMALGREALAAGDPAAARARFADALDREEMALYFGKQAELREARTLELLGDFPAAELQYRAMMAKDPLHAALALRIASIHPERDRLFDEVIARVNAAVADAKVGGESVPIYVTSKGQPRFLEVVPDADVLPRLRAFNAGNADAKLRYCYIENVDFSGLAPGELPSRVDFERCVIGRVRMPDVSAETLVLKGFVLGDFDVGKTWEGEVNKSKTLPGSRFVDVTTRETVFLGRANFQDVAVSGRKAAFPFTVFEQEADFRGARIEAAADFRFSVFAEGANFKRARLGKAVYFGNTRFLKETRFTEMFSEEDVYFNSVRFEGPVHFDACEFNHGATWEDSTFVDSVSFTTSRVTGRLNMSRARFDGPLVMKEVQLGGMDFIGSELNGDASFVDASVDGKVRFSLDDVTRARYITDPGPLLPLYRDYQGDEDAEEPLATGRSYGVQGVDDLIATVNGNLSFANSVFGGFVIFERVRFGLPGADTTAEFYNTQFGGETHFERTTWNSSADFTTIYAEELALNEAVFHRTLLLDDANVPGRVTLTDASFAPDATISFYGAQIATLQVDRGQLTGPDGQHRLWYEACALGRLNPAGDIRLRRQSMTTSVDPEAFRVTCYDRAIDEFVSLKQSFGDRAMTDDEDWAYWWIKHHETFAALAKGGAAAWLALPVRYLLFELAFGWGVRLGNLGITTLLVCVFFTWIYKRFCGTTIMSYDGEDRAIADIPWSGMFYVSLQSLGGFNTGWDYGESDLRFRYFNTLHTYTGVIILTFFVGAYTRMILA